MTTYLAKAGCFLGLSPAAASQPIIRSMSGTHRVLPDSGFWPALPRVRYSAEYNGKEESQGANSPLA